MKKILSFKSITINLFMALFIGGAVSTVMAVTPIVAAVGIFTAGTLPQLFTQGSDTFKTLLYAGLQTEVWIDQLLEDFHPENSFYLDGEDWSEFVEHDKINFAIVGADPTVVVNRTTYPIPVTQRTDTGADVELDEFSTDTTVVRDAEQVELAYKKLETVLAGHKRVLREKYANKGQYNIAPTAHSASTRVIASTGPLRNGFRNPSEADIKGLAEDWDDQNIPETGRVLLLNNRDYWGLMDNIPALAKQYERQAAGTVGASILTIHGFEIKRRNQSALYKLVGGVWTKQAFGTAASADTFAASTAYVKGVSFIYADGTTKMYDSVDDVDQQGTKVNFRHRGLIQVKRQKNIAAFVGVNS